MIRTAAALALILLASTTMANECDVVEEHLLQRPLPENGPTDVTVRVYINDIIKINDAEQSFTSDVYFRAEWMDPRLAHAGPENCRVNEARVWIPGLQLLNRRSLQNVRHPDLEVTPAGMVIRVLRGFGTFSFRADLTDFPFDQQELALKVISVYSEEEVRFVVTPERLGIAQPLSVANWRIELTGAHPRPHYIAPLDRELARLDVLLEAHRLTGFYTWQQLVPLFLIVMMTWVIFWIPLEYVPPRVGLASTAMLTLIAYRFAISSVLPPIAYLTRLDVFMIGASILVFLALVLSVTVTWIAHNRSEERANKINRAAALTSPVMLLLLTVFAFVL